MSKRHAPDPPPPADRMKVEDLHPDPANRRLHPDRNQTMVQESLQSIGAARSIVIDEDDVVLAGNGVIQAAQAAGITNVRIIESAGDELIAVRRRGLTPEQKRALALFDNRTAELATWNLEQLIADRDQGLDLQPFWTETEAVTLLGETVDPSWSGMPEFHQDALAFRSLTVHFANAEDFRAFSELVQRDDLTEKTKFIWYPRAARVAVVGHQAYAGSEPEQD